ncbi:MAG: ABC transporter substrate-binding protein [Propionibacteriaceae bacterium]|jgi:putative ABC transport system substrate-binding protein|nr:ABC transporter substrate-binding protein [Propionibacteriaceae bacterium]
MKLSAKHILVTAMSATMALGLASCATTPGSGTGTEASTTGSEVKYTIAITQFLAHPSLDAITKGIKDVLAEKGLTEGANLTVIYDDAQGEPTNTTTIAGKYAANSSIQLAVGIATPSAQALATAIIDRPVLFAGVTDPVSAGIVPSWDTNPDSNVTGTSDLNPEGKPFGLIEEVLGHSVTKIGYPYTLAEANSKVQLDALRAEAGSGVEVVEAGLTSPSELGTAIQTLKGVDAIYVGTDNTVVTGLDQVVSFCNDNKIPLIAGDAASVERGAIATRGIDYYELGRRTGEMVYDILVNGTKPGDIPPLQVADTQIAYNPAAATAQGVTPPQVFLDKVAITY